MFSKKDVKHCVKCGNGTVKADRDSCKQCGGSEWTTQVAASTDQAALYDSVTSEAKMMDNMDGDEQKDDQVITGNQEEALKALQALVTKDKQDSEAKSTLWDFRSVHLGHGIAKGKSIDDVCYSFLRWCQKEEDRTSNRYNVTKAFRRMKAFAQFADKHFDTYFSTPIDMCEPEIQTAQKMLNFQICQQLSKCGAVIWVIDLASVDTKVDVSEVGMMRINWYIMLASLFDPPVQTEGIIMLQSLAISFGTMIKINSKFKSIEKELNTLFYGTMPLKMKCCILVGSPWWITVLLRIMRLFISKKMSARLVNIDLEGMHARVGGSHLIPGNMGTGDYVPRYAGLELVTKAQEQQVLNQDMKQNC